VKVVGGVYREECLVAYWQRIFGSGGRATAALGALSPGLELHSYASLAVDDDIRHSIAAFGAQTNLTCTESDICFRYLHPMGIPTIGGVEAQDLPPLVAQDDTVLRFGLYEGTAQVEGERVVYDPQNWTQALTFAEGGSRAGTLAVVLNQDELELSTRMHGSNAVEELVRQTGADVVVVKRGPLGALVCQGSDVTPIPAFRTANVFKIGSGDVFSAHFAFEWGESKRSAVDAALIASRRVASYVETRDLQSDDNVSPAAPIYAAEVGSIYLAGPFFTLSQRWLIEEARACLRKMAVGVFSPVHDVGVGGSPSHIAERDLTGLRECGAVLALIDGEDPGTMFEIGYARDRAIPVVALSEAPRAHALTMLQGTGCQIVTDFTSAVYHAVWAACR